MRVEIRALSGEPNRALEEQVRWRLHFALGRFGDRIRQATVQLADLNSPRGGEDQHCSIEVSLVPSGSIVAEATDIEIVLAVGRAAERVARRVRDALDRKRTMRTRTGGLPSENDAPPQSL